jgi:hypothetical protein
VVENGLSGCVPALSPCPDATVRGSAVAGLSGFQFGHALGEVPQGAIASPKLDGEQQQPGGLTANNKLKG